MRPCESSAYTWHKYYTQFLAQKFLPLKIFALYSMWLRTIWWWRYLEELHKRYATEISNKCVQDNGVLSYRWRYSNNAMLYAAQGLTTQHTYHLLTPLYGVSIFHSPSTLPVSAHWPTMYMYVYIIISTYLSGPCLSTPLYPLNPPTPFQ